MVLKERGMNHCLAHSHYVIERVSELPPRPLLGRLVLSDGWKCLLGLQISTWHLAVI